MRSTSARTGIAVLALALALAVPAAAREGAPAPAKKESGALGSLGGGKEPIKIDADRLDVFDRENKAVFVGNVVAVQGDSTIRCSTMTVHYKRGKDKDGKEADAAEKAPDKAADRTADNGIQRVDCAGPVTVVQKDQVATGDNAVFDQAAKRIVLTGNVVLSQCQNVTRGQRLVYDMNTGRANMDPVAGGRVSALFVPGEKADAKGGTAGAGKGCPPPPAAAKAAPKAAETKPDEARPADGPARARAQAN